jgi:hypothetical protein
LLAKNPYNVMTPTSAASASRRMLNAANPSVSTIAMAASKISLLVITRRRRRRAEAAVADVIYLTSNT